MTLSGVLLSLIFVPTVGAFLLPVIGRWSKALRNSLAFLFVFYSFVASAILLPGALAGKAVQFAIAVPLGFNFAFTADALAVFMALVSSSISAIIILYSFGYIDHYGHQNEYYAMVVLFLGAMMGLIFASNLIILYAFWEITAIASWRLIGFFREKIHVQKADKAFLVTVFGALLMLVGFAMLYERAGSFDLAVIGAVFKTQAVPKVAVALILAGILSKSATLPFHTWLPDAGVAPSPVTALLHAAVLVKIGVYVFARLFVATLPLEAYWHTVVPIIAAVSALVSAGAALVETDLKRIVAYSTISQIGFIFLGLSVGNPIAVAGGLLYILMHGLAKAGLFLCAGIIEHNAKTKDITKLGGLAATMPLTAAAFLLCALSVMGIPPFGGFFSKTMVMTGAVASGQTTIALVFLFGAILTILYLFRAFKLIFLGEAKIPAPEGNGLMVASVVALAVLSLAGGLLIRFPAEAVQKVIQIAGVVK